MCNYNVIVGKPVPSDVYQRIQNLEMRILQVESMSPEYFDMTVCFRVVFYCTRYYAVITCMFSVQNYILTCRLDNTNTKCLFLLQCEVVWPVILYGVVADTFVSQTETTKN